MNSQDLSSLLQNQVNELFAMFQAAQDNVTRAKLNYNKNKMQWNLKNAKLIEQLEKMNIAMRDLIAERDILKRCNQVQIQATKENAEKVRELLELIKDLELQTLRFKVMPYQKEINLKLQEQHAKVLIDKDMEIQTLKSQLAASQEESARKEEELQELHAKESSDKSQLIYNPNMRLCLEEQKYSEKIVELMVLQEQFVKQMKDKDVEIQTLKAQLSASQEESTSKNMKLLEQYLKELADRNLVIGELEARLSAAEQQTIDKLKVLEEQHVKELNNKDLAIQDLETRLSAAEQQTVDKIMELTNEKDRHSQVIQKFREDSLLAEQRLQRVRMIYKEILRQTMKEAAKDSEIQNLKEMIQGEDEINENLMAKDGKIEAFVTENRKNN